MPFPLVYEAARGFRLDIGHAVWKIGKAFLKVLASEPLSATTRGHVALQALLEGKVTFAILEIRYHGEWE